MDNPSPHKKLTPLEQLQEGHDSFTAYAKQTRMAVLKGKHNAPSIEKSLAKANGYELHKGYWVHMEIVDPDADPIELQLPAFAVEALEHLPEEA